MLLTLRTLDERVEEEVEELFERIGGGWSVAVGSASRGGWGAAVGGAANVRLLSGDVVAVNVAVEIVRLALQRAIGIARSSLGG